MNDNTPSRNSRRLWHLGVISIRVKVSVGRCNLGVGGECATKKGKRGLGEQCLAVVKMFLFCPVEFRSIFPWFRGGGTFSPLLGLASQLHSLTMKAGVSWAKQVHENLIQLFYNQPYRSQIACSVQDLWPRPAPSLVCVCFCLSVCVLASVRVRKGHETPGPPVWV